jgi:prolyl 4-hydroxylase
MISHDITPELRKWLVKQTGSGFAPEKMLEAMLTSGWSDATARQALAEISSGTIEPKRGKTELRDEPVPEPDLLDLPTSLQVDGRDVTVLMALQRPRVVVLGGFLSDIECDKLVALARERLERSETVVGATGESEVSEVRSSEGMFFERAEHEVCERIEARIAALLNWPVENGEGLQVLRYGPGAEYRPHYDYFDPGQAGSSRLLLRGGQRVATMVMYLNTPAKGGATVFPDAGLAVSPVKGNAVFFSYARPDPTSASLHGGSPVQAGEKWVATKWLREREFA